jgi:hypothetical protein
MKLLGDPQGIEELRFFSETDEKKEYLKLLLNEAKTNTDNTTTFKDRNSSVKYTLVYNPGSGDFTIDKA